MKKKWIAVVCAFGAFAAGAAVVKEYQRVDGNANAPLPGKLLRSDMFADASIWNVPTKDSNYGNRLSIKREEGALTVTKSKSAKRKDTAWNVTTKPLPLTVKGLGYVFSFGLEASPRLKNAGGSQLYSCAVMWYDHTGKMIMRDPFPLRSAKDGRRRVVMVGSVPAAAESYAVQFGFDRPDIVEDGFVKLDSLEFSVMPHETDLAWKHAPVPEAPRIKIVSDTPFSDRLAELKISVTSNRPIDWSTLKITLDGKESTKDFSREGDILTYRPSKKWRDGIHKANVTLVDPEEGTSITAEKIFYFGYEVKAASSVTLRDDGMTLIGDKPFFPIGIYGLRTLPVNGNDLEKAVRDVAEAGFNFVHSYQAGTKKEFLDLAQKYGLKTWTGVRIPGTNFVETLRRHPAVLAWYVGDDTAMHYTPQQIYDRVDGVNAIDPRRITCQADVMNSGDAVSSYRPFVKVTDVFMPEIYPVHGEKPNPHEKCVAVTIRDMKRFKRDVEETKDDKPHGIWPIIQYFKGWTSWKRFPNRDELYAMTFASIAHGAHGVTWYTYGGTVEPEKKKFNYGVTATSETWCNITNLVSRLKELSPVLVTRTPVQPKPAKIISGPATDVLGNESISMLVKHYCGETYLIAVNGTLKDVTAEFDLGVRPSQAEVLWENRMVAVSAGKITDTFAPFAVHVYRIADPITYIAHQGEEALAPGHSLAAYRIAAKNKLDFLKLDLRETKDGHVVLQHDGTLKATMAWDVKISDHTLAEIREHGGFKPRGGYGDEKIVTLSEALEIAKGMKQGIWLDFKHFTPKFAEKVFRLVDEAGYASDRIMVATFTKPALRWVQKNRPQVRRVAHTFIRKVKGGFQMNAGDELKIYPTVDAVAEGLIVHAKAYGLHGFNVPHIYRSGRQLYQTPPSLVRSLRKAGYWISIWFTYDPGTAEYYREAGADAFVTNWRARTYPEFQPQRERWAKLMRVLAKVPEEISDAGSKRRNEALEFCTWEPRLAAEAIMGTGKWPMTSKEVIDILETASWKMPEEREPKKPEDKFDLSEGGGNGAFIIRNAERVSLKNTVVDLYSEDSAAVVDCVKNGSFEMRGKAAEGSWKLPKGWRFERGFGRNGGGGLVFETSERLAKATWAEQIFDIKPGAVYNLTAWIEGRLDSPKGLFAVAHFLDAEGKKVGFARTVAHGANRKWGMVSARTKRLPANARKVRICLYVPDGAVGKAFFDDVTFVPYKVEPVTALCSSCYRNEAVAGEGAVRFFAGIDLNDASCTKETSEVVFSFDAADGQRIRRKACAFDGDDVCVDVDPREMKLGEQEIAAEVVRRDGTVAGRRTLKFSRLERRPERPVWIDRDRRVILNGKPFFPIAVYCTRAESNIVEIVGKSPFNTLMAYSGLDWAMLDWCKAHGLMASLHAGDLSCTDRGISRMVNRLKDHPAILTWLMNDERPLSMLPQLHSRYRTIRENDDGHPTWAVLYQVDDMRGYVGTCDAIGSDPYPVSHASVKLAHDWAEKTRKATFGAMSMWQTVQVFDWAAYKTKGVQGTDVSKYRAPTLAEMKIMTWFQIASGANALFMYSYNPLVKMDWRDPFKKKWAEVCECVGEIAAVSDIILSVEKAPVLKNVPSGLSVRTWRKDGNVHLLVCNASGKSLKGKLPLSAEFSGKMRTVFGGGAVREGDSLSLAFPLEGYAFLAFAR